MEIESADASGSHAEPTQRPGSSKLEHAALWIERPVRQLAGSNRLNPLPHAGTISVFLLGVVTVSGLYITLFFEFGHVASYEAVAKMEQHAIQKVVRALHRYSSAALVLTTLVHAWRIFAAGRFKGGPRPWRWATGFAALVLVWLAGVTGYWLVWDQRAQALNEATLRLLRSAGVGRQFLLRELSGLVPGSGSGFLLVLWFAHLFLTIAIGWFAFRHLRRSRLPWYPPTIWMTLMGGALVLVSVAVPVGMLGPARADLMPASMPLDPFVMFLLPPLLSDFNWVMVGVSSVAMAVAFALPRLLRGPKTQVVAIDADACTGCDLCAVDCPYDALAMVARGTDQPTLAVLDAARCVGCGICLGSCSFGAIDHPELGGRNLPSVAGKHVTIACERHLMHSEPGGPLDPADRLRVVSGVRCAGSFDPSAIRPLTEQGALDVHLVGCPPGDCLYGIGNQLASERMRGERAPHPARKFYGNIIQDWVSPLDLTAAIDEPGEHSSSNIASRPGGRNRLIGAGLLVSLSVVAVVAATRAPFRTQTETAEIRIGVDHVAGRELALAPAEGPVSRIEGIQVVYNSDPLGSQAVDAAGERSLDLLDWSVPAGAGVVEVRVLSDGDERTVLTADVDLEPGHRQSVLLNDVPPPPGARDGRTVFDSRQVGCQVCHSVEPGDDGVGPTLYGVASRAGSLVEGLDAELYLRQSILLPDQYIVDGWPSGQMLPIYLDRLSEQDLDALIAYLLTLTEEER
ncbi:MAG: c-type cytochrome [Acidimicrobiales bacterium]|nr:c-type cytochrome [Acidimicrobiales bacterium]